MYNFLGRHRSSPRTVLLESGHANSRRSTRTTSHDPGYADNRRLQRAEGADSEYADSEILNQDNLNEKNEKPDIIEGLL